MPILRSAPHHIPFKYKSPNYCCVQFRDVDLTWSTIGEWVTRCNSNEPISTNSSCLWGVITLLMDKNPRLQMKCCLCGHRSTAWELLEVLSTWMSHRLWTTFLINVRRVGDELRWRGDIHLLKPFIGHNRSAHGHQLEVMVEMLHAWIEKAQPGSDWKCSPLE